jgi:hypothetical protein
MIRRDSGRVCFHEPMGCVPDFSGWLLAVVFVVTSFMVLLSIFEKFTINKIEKRALLH